MNATEELHHELPHEDSQSVVRPAISQSPSHSKDEYEVVSCYLCGSSEHQNFVVAEDDLTGKPGKFRFVRCTHCDLVFQNPRLTLSSVGAYYDDEYIAHRKKKNWGILTPLYNRAMDKHDRDKVAIVNQYVTLNENSKVLDIGCGAGTFLIKVKSLFSSKISGVDFKDLRHLPWFAPIQFYHGVFYQQDFADQRFDLITMWHFLEHDYDPVQTLCRARDVLSEDGRMIIEVPRLDSLSARLFQERWPGLQAPQHTVLYSKASLLAMMDKADLEIVEYLPYGSFPPYFYLFAGVAFKFLKGKGLNLSRAIYPYFLGQLLLLPVILLQRHLNLAMQTVVCRPKRKDRTS
jgi:SAM-dependent methyltransferase